MKQTNSSLIWIVPHSHSRSLALSSLKSLGSIFVLRIRVFPFRSVFQENVRIRSAYLQHQWRILGGDREGAPCWAADSRWLQQLVPVRDPGRHQDAPHGHRVRVVPPERCVLFLYPFTFSNTLWFDWFRVILTSVWLLRKWKWEFLTYSCFIVWRYEICVNWSFLLRESLFYLISLIWMICSLCYSHSFNILFWTFSCYGFVF